MKHKLKDCISYFIKQRNKIFYLFKVTDIFLDSPHVPTDKITK